MMKAKILIVDDFPENIRALSELIAADDVEIYTASNAEQALELVTQHNFSLGLFDVQMPEITGFELARLIRGVSQYNSLPIIFVTAHSETSELILEGYETGAVDLLFKPLHPHVVRSKVRVFVELDRQRRLLKEKLEEVERLKLVADSANMAKGHFLANMSHEIRTPLAAVMGFSEMIAKGQLSESEKPEYVSAIKRNGNLLLRLIDDILDFSKIESGSLDMEKIDFDFADLVKDVDASMSLKAQQKGLNLHFDVDTAQTNWFIGDPTRIKQVLLNVIGNAIKFTPKGNVSVTIKGEPLAGMKPSQRITVLVKDDGIGLTPIQASRLFKPFAQADASTTRRFGGSGLGLTISKRIANQMGGNVELVDSEQGEGSTFEISFVLEMAKAKMVTTPVVNKTQKFSEIPDLSSFKILVVDDLPDNLALINLFLRATKVQMRFAENGEEAVAQVAGEEFDLILMDVQMPGLDGHGSTIAIRENGYRKPIIALTAHAMNTEHEKCIQSGCSDVLAKPVTRETLVRTIKKFLQPEIQPTV